MYGQLGLEGFSKRCKSLERASNFHEFLSEELHSHQVQLKIEDTYGDF